jgi:polysaccharide export outer membrane protein
MKFKSFRPNRWIVLLPAVAIAMFSAAAQAQKQTSKQVPADDPAPTAKPAPPVSSETNHEYVIGENDLLDIDVWKEKEISRTIPVRPDGKISLPLIGEIQASGLTPLELQADIAKRYKAYIENPDVTVIVADPRSHQFNIVGQVAKPGTYPLSESMTVLDGIAAAGGFRDFAKETKVYVLRPVDGGIQVRIPFNYKDVIRGKNIQENVSLKPGDTIVVP